MCIRDRLNIYINEIEFENTFLVVKGLSLDVILGNDFLERNGAVIDFNKRIVEFNRGVNQSGLILRGY